MVVKFAMFCPQNRFRYLYVHLSKLATFDIYNILSKFLALASWFLAIWQGIVTSVKMLYICKSLVVFDLMTRTKTTLSLHVFIYWLGKQHAEYVNFPVYQENERGYAQSCIQLKQFSYKDASTSKHQVNTLIHLEHPCIIHTYTNNNFLVSTIISLISFFCVSTQDSI